MMKSFLRLSLSFFVLFNLAGCEKKSDDQVVKTSLNQETQSALASFSPAVANYLPNETAAFWIVRKDFDAYKKIAESPYKLMLGTGLLPTTANNNLSKEKNIELQKILGILEKAGLNKEGVIKNGVSFITGKLGANSEACKSDATKACEASITKAITPNIDFGIYLEGPELSKKIASLKQELEKSDPSIKINSLKLSDKEGLTITSGEASFTIFSEGDFAGISTNPEYAIKPITKSTSNKITELSNSKSFGELYANTELNSASTLMFSFADISKFADFKIDGEKPLKDILPNLPEAAGIVTSYKDFPEAEIRVLMTKTGNSIFNEKTELSKSIPGSVALGGSLRLNIKDILNTFLSEDASKAQSNPKSKEVNQVTEIANEFLPKDIKDGLSTINEVGLSVMQGSADALFPVVSFYFASSDAPKLGSSLKALVSNAGKSFGVTIPAWEDTAVDGIATSSFMAPLGIGVVIGIKDNTVVLTSAKQGIKLVSETISGQSKSLIDSMKNRSGFVSGYLNADKIAYLIETVQGNLSMFTGGKSRFDRGSLDEIRKLGTVSLIGGFEGERVIKIGVSAEPVVVEKK